MLNFSAKALKKLLTLNGWRQFLKILTKKERIIFSALFILFLGSAIFLTRGLYLKITEIKPARGGSFVEGVIGQPRFINPIYAASNDVDRDLVELLFSGLMKYDGNGEIVPDLAKEVKTEEDGKIFRVYLKDNLFWSDSNSHPEYKLTAEDVLFTIETIQNQDYKSPLRASWLGVEAEKISDTEIKFRLKNPYSAFLENLTLKILPKHIWKDISPQNFPLTIYNLKPIGSGLYKFEELEQDNSGQIKSLTLKINSKYYGPKPYLSKITFRFFDSEEKLFASARKNEIDGFAPSALQDIKNGSFNGYLFTMPRYFAVFFNPEKSKTLSSLEIRQALNYGTDKKEIVDKVLDSQAEIVDSPILSEIYGFNAPEKIYQFNLEEAKSLLKKAGFVENKEGIREKIVEKEPAFQFKSDLKVGSAGTEVQELQKCLAKDPAVYPAGEITGSFGSKTREAVIKFQEKYRKDILDPSGLTEGTGLVSKATRAKLNELCAAPSEEKITLSFSLTTVDQPLLLEIANILKEQWKILGIDVNIKTFDISTLEREIIKTRNYEAILFGEVLGKIPDPFPFWDSVQIKDPGLNLALYENKDADKLLEEARQNLNEEERKEKLEKFQNILIKDAPAVFLYSPDYAYLVSKEIKGINEKMITDPSKRFSGIENWYVKTKRALK